MRKKIGDISQGVPSVAECLLGPAALDALQFHLVPLPSYRPTAHVSFPLSHSAAPLSCSRHAGVTPSGLHQSQSVISVSSNLEPNALGQMKQWPLETHSENSSSIPVHSYKSSFLDESVVRAEQSIPCLGRRGDSGGPLS